MGVSKFSRYFHIFPILKSNTASTVRFYLNYDSVQLVYFRLDMCMSYWVGRLLETDCSGRVNRVPNTTARPERKHCLENFLHSRASPQILVISWTKLSFHLKCWFSLLMWVFLYCIENKQKHRYIHSNRSDWVLYNFDY